MNSALKSIPGQENFQLQHLRRFAKSPFLPTWLQETLDKATTITTKPKKNERRSGAEARRTSSSDSQSDNSSRSSSSRRSPRAAFMLLCPTTIISEEELTNHLKAWVPSLFENVNNSTNGTERSKFFHLLTHRVPLFSPSTLETASELSRTTWPIIFNPNTTYGPNPADLAKVQAKLQVSTGKYMNLAEDVAWESHSKGFGVQSGAVIVERCTTGREDAERVVCVAGDGRYWDPASTGIAVGKARSSHFHNQVGNPAGHAVMRAISIVAAKRRAIACLASASTEIPVTKPPSLVPLVDTVFLENPLLSLEEDFNPRVNTLTPNGYLCLDLEIYLTHEPCVMCCMALNHSRFGRVIFGREMPKTGGLCAERRTETRSTKYGLFWRDELTWRILTWQWKRNDATTEGQLKSLRLEEPDDDIDSVSM